MPAGWQFVFDIGWYIPPFVFIVCLTVCVRFVRRCHNHYFKLIAITWRSLKVKYRQIVVCIITARYNVIAIAIAHTHTYIGSIGALHTQAYGFATSIFVLSFVFPFKIHREAIRIRTVCMPHMLDRYANIPRQFSQPLSFAALV